MDSRAHHGSRPPAATPHTASKNPQEKRFSSRQQADPTPNPYVSDESPIIPTYAQPGQYKAYRPPNPQNGTGESASLKGRESQAYSGAGSAISAPPAVSGGAPPVSYRDPSTIELAATRSRSASNPYASGAQMPLSVTVPASQPHTVDYTAVSSAPPASQDGPRRSLVMNPVMSRRSSVPDRSPLQKLEVKLEDISKEEKRARVEEAEHLAQQRLAAARESRRVSRDAYVGSAPQRTVSGSGRSNTLLATAGDSRRNVPVPNDGLLDSSHPEKGSLGFGPPWVPLEEATLTEQTASMQRKRYYSNAGSQPTQPYIDQPQQYDGLVDSAAEHNRRESRIGVQRGASFRDRAAGTNVDRYGSHHPHSRRDATPTGGAAATTGLGLYTARETSRRHEQLEEPESSGGSSKRSQRDSRSQEPRRSTGNKDSSVIPTSQKQLQSDRTGKRHGIEAARRYQEPDPVPPAAVRNPHASVPKYEVPPQTAGGRHARDQVGFGQADPAELAPTDPHGYHDHLPRLFYDKHHEPEGRRHQTVRSLDEWKRAGTATLAAGDLDLDASDNNREQRQAWRERGGSQRVRSDGVRQELAYTSSPYDGNYEQPVEQTSLKPQLYLKCGPLLRYTGLRRQDPSRGGAEREVWRGSVMVVTVDAASSYDPVPTLRLFAQPMDLLPPATAEVAAVVDPRLAPEYVDPLAGHPKLGRTGKTLYVRPADDLEAEVDLSRVEDEHGLFTEFRIPSSANGHVAGGNRGTSGSFRSRIHKKDGERLGRYREVKGVRLHAERGVTFWRFNLEVELGSRQHRVAYRINRGPAIGFWVPARGETMNMMFHSCNGFSVSVDPNIFSGPDPLWRDVLNNHLSKPFHVMIGGGDQLYNDAAMRETTYFQEWLATKNPVQKHSAEFTPEMQEELEDFYLNRYAMWFSQGLFGLANSQIPMVNMWDDHDIIDGFGSYPHHFMSTAVFTGLGAVAYKYYMLFQQQSVPDETEQEEPSWLLGAAPGPYINELSRSVFVFMGRRVAFLGLDCRIERMRDEVLSQETYDLVFDRCRREIVRGETKHLVVLLGIPFAYPRLNFLENILTSKVMDPIKALGRAAMLGNFLNKFDGGVEILDDLDDHWTAKHHKRERNWFVQELQELAAEKSVRITVLSGDVHLAAIGQFYSNKKLGVSKDRDHRYMPNIISSAIVNTPPPELMADVLNKRNKVHHLDPDTDEDMIPLFTHDVDGKPRNNHHLLPRRNWCSIREYQPGSTPPTTPPLQTPPTTQAPPGRLTRTLSLSRRDFAPVALVRRLSRSDRGAAGPYSTATPGPAGGRPGRLSRSASVGGPARPTESSPSYFPPPQDPPRPNPFHRRPTGLSEKAALKGGSHKPSDGAADGRGGHINLEGGLDVVLNVEVDQKDPAGVTTPYRLLVPALDYRGAPDAGPGGVKGKVETFFEGLMGRRRPSVAQQQRGGRQEEEEGLAPEDEQEGRAGRGHSQYELYGRPDAVTGMAPVQQQQQQQQQVPRASYSQPQRAPEMRYQAAQVPTGRHEGGVFADPTPARNQYRGDQYGDLGYDDEDVSEGSISPPEEEPKAWHEEHRNRASEEKKKKSGWKIWK